MSFMLFLFIPLASGFPSTINRLSRSIRSNEWWNH